MDQVLHEAAEPVFWWWEEDGGARVLLLSGDTLVLSGPLDGRQVTDLEAARQHGNVLSGNFGTDALWVEIDAIREMRYVRTERRLQLLRDGGTDAIQPPVSAGGVAAGAFEVLRERLAPDTVVRDVVQSAEPNRFIDEIRLLAGLTVLSLVALGLGFVAGEDAVVTGPFTWLRQPVNDVFATVGLIPAAVGSALATVVLIARGIRRRRGKRTRSGAMVRVVTIGGLDLQAQAESILQSTDSFERPLLGPADDAFQDDELESLIPVPSSGAEARSLGAAFDFVLAEVELPDPPAPLSADQLVAEFDDVLAGVELQDPPPPLSEDQPLVVEMAYDGVSDAASVSAGVAVPAESLAVPVETEPVPVATEPAAVKPVSAAISDREPPRPAWATSTDTGD